MLYIFYQNNFFFCIKLPFHIVEFDKRDCVSQIA